LALLRQAAGSPRDVAAKVRRLGGALRAYVDMTSLDDRLDRLHRLGMIEVVPNRVQLVVGAIDMLRFWINPAAADYYERRGIHYGFHQLLRVLEEPASMVDPTGFLSSRDNIIGHLMQVVHANPAYDLQLLMSHGDGLDELERQLDQMLAGTHPRASSIGAIVEEPDYHARLLRYTRAYRESPDAEAPLRDNVAADPSFRALEQTFGTLPAAMRYFASLPKTPAGAIVHLLTVRELPRRHAGAPHVTE
jgi:hypothetical protein